MAFQYKNSDRRGNPAIRFCKAAGWWVDYEYFTSGCKVKLAESFLQNRENLLKNVKDILNGYRK